MRKDLTHKEALEAYKNGKCIHGRVGKDDSRFIISRNMGNAETFRASLEWMLEADELWLELEEPKKDAIDLACDKYQDNSENSRMCSKELREMYRALIAEAVRQGCQKMADALFGSLNSTDTNSARSILERSLVELRK